MSDPDPPAAAKSDRLAELRAVLSDLTLVDAHRLRRRIDRIDNGRRRRSGPNASSIEELARDVERATAVVAARRAAVPELNYPPDLPVTAARPDIAAAIAAHQVVVIAGETGSGKTTQIPKICLELGRGVHGMIGHTQPRRLAASSVATRIADETGTQPGAAVGYAVRFSDKTSRDTLVKVMTDGILLREIAADPMLRAYDTLIIDEAHERSLNIDFILGFLRQLLPRRPDLKVIITSATIEPDRFAAHFTTPQRSVPILEVSGRTYPVDIRYRPWGEPGDADETGTDNDHADLDQIGAVDAAIGELWSGSATGDILVFLPTERDIRDTADALRHRAAAGAEIVPLFARLSNADQRRVFAPSNGRRIVLATNVAETSLTVPGIRYVVDTGTARIARYSTRTKVNRLPIEPVSQASARQRAGRCGRVAPGVCIRLYSEADFDARAEYTDPEILRTNLAGVILSMLSLKLGDIASFPFVQAPSERAIRDGLAVLNELGAIHSPDGSVGADAPAPALTRVGRELATLPIDPRLGRMLVEARRLGCLDQVLIIAAALSVPDVRERPAEHRQAADELHRRFDVPGSDFLSYLQLWEHLTQQRKSLSTSKFRRTCEREFLHWVRIREWRDLHRQLTEIVTGLGWQVTPTEADAAAVHRSVLSGLLGNIAARNGDTRDYTGARNTTLAIFPASSLSKKPPPFIMAAEIMETSRLFAHTVAGIDPRWAEGLAGDLAKRTYSEPHWSAKHGATMAYERVTLYGVVLVAARRVNFTSIDPELSREMFIRSALVEGQWRTDHEFFARNRALLDEVSDIEHRARRRGLSISDDALFEFYEHRIPTEVTSARHFDKWWRNQRRTEPALLDLTEADVVAADGQAVAENDFPGAWAQGSLRMDLQYKFAPGEADDGVTVVVPLELLAHVRPAGFDWSVPGFRSELAAELIKTLPKPLRKTMSPAARYADAALARLQPRSQPLVTGLAQELSAITGTTITAADFDLEKVPPHLRMNFRLVDTAGHTLATAKSLSELTAATRGNREPKKRAPVYREWTVDGIGTLDDERVQSVAGQQVTRYPTLKPVENGVTRALAANPGHRDHLLHASAAVLLAAALPSLPIRLTRGLDAAGTLALSQSPYSDHQSLLDDCRNRAVAETLLPEHSRRLRTPQDFAALTEQLSGPIGRCSIDVFDTVVDALRHVAPLRAAIDAHAGSLAADDVAEQLHNLIHPGFVAHTTLTDLTSLPRYLRAAQQRLENLAGAPDRDAAGLAVIDRVVTAWNDRSAQLPAHRRAAFDDFATWQVEELRVGIFAQRVGTAFPVSEKRIRRAFADFR